MKNLRNLILAGAAVLCLMAPHEASAFTAVMCSPDITGNAMARRVINPNNLVGSPLAPQAYSLNGQGCAVMNQADIGYFQSQGFSVGPSQGQPILYNTGVQTSTTDLIIGSIPPNAYIQQIIVANLTANAVTGGISFGTTANGTDIDTALPVAASAVAFATDALTVKRVFSTTVSTPIHAAAVTAWNSANVNITIVYGYF
jgi:hypothetical protein